MNILFYIKTVNNFKNIKLLELFMINQQNAELAILSVFPTSETLDGCVADFENRELISSVVDFAFSEGVIDVRDQSVLSAFVKKSEQRMKKPFFSNELNFEELFQQKKEILHISISARALTDRVNLLISQKNIALPRLTNTMLTRLKKEPADTLHKKNALRSLAFWLGYERPDLEGEWNFETLLALCRTARSDRKINEGVRIGLTLSSRGDVIGHDAVVWLKKNIKNYIQHAMNILPYSGWGIVRSYDITTLYIDLPRDGNANYPTSYQQSIRNAISIAHQIAVRWALSDYCTKNRFLSIGIATGEFANLNNYLLPILNAKLPGDPVIRMTDYTRQCILIGDMRTVFCSSPKVITLFNGETLNIWWVAGLWSAVYWDFIPGLLEDELLQNTPESMKRLNRFFMSPDYVADSSRPDAVTKFFAIPHNSLLGIEIAKTLYYRRCFFEAHEILRVVLSIDPVNVNARSLKMMICRIQAVEAPSYAIAMVCFEMARKEALLIVENCNTLEEDFFCEYAVIFLSQAILTLRRMRKGLTGRTAEDTAKLKSDVFYLLARSQELFEKGFMVSPTGYRSNYLLFCTKTLAVILQQQDDFFANPGQPISIPKRVYRHISEDILIALNIYRWHSPEKPDYAFLESIIMEICNRHNKSTTLKSYRPTLYFCFAVMMWDFLPVRTVNSVKAILNYLYDAIPMAEALMNQNLYIYSYTRSYGEMLEPREFISHIEKTIQMVEACAGTIEELENRDPSAQIADNDRDFTMFTIHI